MLIAAPLGGPDSACAEVCVCACVCCVCVVVVSGDGGEQTPNVCFAPMPLTLTEKERVEEERWTQLYAFATYRRAAAEEGIERGEVTEARHSNALRGKSGALCCCAWTVWRERFRKQPNFKNRKQRKPLPA